MEGIGGYDVRKVPRIPWKETSRLLGKRKGAFFNPGLAHEGNDHIVRARSNLLE